MCLAASKHAFVCVPVDLSLRSTCILLLLQGDGLTKVEGCNPQTPISKPITGNVQVELQLAQCCTCFTFIPPAICSNHVTL